MQVPQSSVHVRQYGEHDYSFILNSYLKSYRLQECNTAIHNDTYYLAYKKILDKLLKRGTCLVACSPEDVDQIFAWILYEDIDDISLVHFVYTKYTYRKMSIAKTLFKVAKIPSTKIVCTHLPLFYQRIKDKIIFNPFLR